MTELQLYLERQPAITKRFESDQLELIETIERAALNQSVERCFMGRGRGTTTILTHSLHWLQSRWGFEFPVVVAPRMSEQVLSIHRMRGQTRLTSSGQRCRPDFWLVDWDRDRSAVGHARDMQALRINAYDMHRGVLVNVGGD
jgi:hypothetical protein